MAEQQPDLEKKPSTSLGKNSPALMGIPMHLSPGVLHAESLELEAQINDIRDVMERLESKADALSIAKDLESPCLPGDLAFSPCGDIQKDLVTLKSLYQQRYQELLSRKFSTVSKRVKRHEPGKHPIRVIQFNMLADGLSDAYLMKATGKSFHGVDPKALEWRYRGFKIVEELLRFEPDIITMQEVDRADFLKYFLQYQGFEVFFQPKTKSPTRHVAKQIAQERSIEKYKLPEDGVLIAYRADKFDLQGKPHYFKQQDNKDSVVALAVVLRPKWKIHRSNASADWKEEDDMSDFIVATTHLKSTKKEAGERLRECQIQTLLNDMITNDKKLPIILGCDLNANPIRNEREKYPPLCYNKIIGDFGFKSAYREGSGIDAEPIFTTWKQRDAGVDKHTIDYIFMKDSADLNWSVISLLSIPNQALPAWNYPSDHYAIGCDFTLSSVTKGETPPLPGDIDINITGDIVNDLKVLRHLYKKMYHELLPREFVATKVKKKSSKKLIRVVQFNILADGLSDAYLLSQTKKSFCGVSPMCLEWRYRGFRIIEELYRLNPDIITLQECDQVSFFEKYLKEMGYDFFFQPKSKSPTRHVAKQISVERGLKNYKLSNDGILIAFKNKKFKLIGDVYPFAQDPSTENVIGLCIRLRPLPAPISPSTDKAEKKEANDPSRDFLVLTTHLKSTKKLEGEQLRVRQTKILLGQKLAQANKDGLPVVFSCDLNARPTHHDKEDYPPLCYKEIVGKFEFVSAYQQGRGAEPDYTTWKKREHGVDKHTIDYIFTKNSKKIKWQVASLLTIPNQVLPAWNYPSDHYAIGTDLFMA